MRNTTVILAMPMIPTFDCIDIDMLAELSWARTLVSDDLPLPPSGPVPSTLSPSSKPQPIMRLWPEPDVWCAELWLFQINYLMTWCCIHLMPRSLTCTPRLYRTEREKLAGNGFSNTIIIPVSFSHLKFQYHIVFNLVSIHLNLFYILLKSNVATDRFKTQSLFPWNLDNFFLILAGQIQIECKSTKIQTLSSYNRSPELKVIIAVYGICDVFVVSCPAVPPTNN